MPITTAEILELESLLDQRDINDLKKGLTHFDKKTSPNYILLHESIRDQRYNRVNELIAGNRGCVLEGSSRSQKTWSGIDIIIWLCTEVETSCKINIYREFFSEFKDTLYDDFKRRLDDFGLPNPFHNAQVVYSFKIGNNKISFIGCDSHSGSQTKGKKHGAGCDYAFFNEGMHVSQAVFDQVEMRCRKFWWIDYNPSFTHHWIFNSVIPRPDVAFLRTTFQDNHHITPQERGKILGYEPWEPGSYELVEVGDGVKVEIFYNGSPVSDKNQPPPHKENVKNGTANEFDWKVYGLGLRGAMEGAIFPYVNYIDSFPDMGYSYSADFGFTVDPFALVKYGETKTDIFMELLCYQPIDNPEDISNFMDSIGIERHLPITADSSDKYTGENRGTVEMVVNLREMGWKITKVHKSRSIMYWLGSMKKKKINIVINHLSDKMKTEQENYIMKKINGISINQPIDGFDHGFTAGRYGHMAWNVKKGIKSRKR